MENIQYYIALIVAIVVGVILLKKVASCLINALVTIVLIAIFVASLNYLGVISLW